MRRNYLEIMILITILLICMYIVDYYIQPNYFIKSIIKIFLFLFVPTFYSVKAKAIPIKNLFKVRSVRDFLKSIALGVGIYIFIITCYFILKSFIDLDNIKSILDTSLSVNRNNFIYVSLYISFINSLLEEIFFRGFIFFNLKRSIPNLFAHSISAFTFSIYHVAMLMNWFNPILFLVALTGLFIGGLLFNWLNEENENIYNSWLVHMFANFAINTVGLIMFEII